MSQTQPSMFDIAVIGGGATGFASALVAAGAGLRTVLFAPPAAFAPGRTAALLQGSIDVLAALDVWPALASHAAPLSSIRIVDGTRRLIRAPEVSFESTEIGLTCFGYNVPNADLVDALRRRAEALEGLTIVSSPVQSARTEAACVVLETSDAAFSASLAVAADGSRSLMRQAAGIDARSWSYPQAALVTTLATERPHAGVSTEFHTESGPFTLVPLPGNRVSLVWVDRPDRVEAAARLPAEALSRDIEARAHSIHGGMQVDSEPAVFPLRAALADRFAARRTMLVGEAAHLFPPIGAQGLNLGFRDIAALRRILARYREDPGGTAALAAYHAARQADVRARTLGIDLLNRSLLTHFLPVQAVRGFGLGLAASVPAVRRALMQQGLARGRLQAQRN